MAVIVDTVLLEAAAMCGDRNQTLYTDDKLLPLIKRANRDLNMELALAGINVVEGEHTSTTIAAVTGVEHPNSPNDLSIPIKLWERLDASVSNQDWVIMEERDWDPAEEQVEDLKVWKFSGEKILFRGATAAHKVRMLYRRNLQDIVDVNSAITVVNGDHFLAAKTASYAARFVGKNASLGAELNGEATIALGLLLGVRIREDQNEVLRMKPYSMNYRR